MKLTPAQARALAAAGHMQLSRDRTGYAHGLSGPHHAPRTLDALARHGLVKLHPMRGCMGTATITKAGRDWLAASREERR